MNFTQNPKAEPHAICQYPADFHPPPAQEWTPVQQQRRASNSGPASRASSPGSALRFLGHGPSEEGRTVKEAGLGIRQTPHSRRAGHGRKSVSLPAFIPRHPEAHPHPSDHSESLHLVSTLTNLGARSKPWTTDPCRHTCLGRQGACGPGSSAAREPGLSTPDTVVTPHPSMMRLLSCRSDASTFISP